MGQSSPSCSRTGLAGLPCHLFWMVSTWWHPQSFSWLWGGWCALLRTISFPCINCRLCPHTLSIFNKIYCRIATCFKWRFQPSTTKNSQDGQEAFYCPIAVHNSITVSVTLLPRSSTFICDCFRRSSKAYFAPIVWEVTTNCLRSHMSVTQRLMQDLNFACRSTCARPSRNLASMHGYGKCRVDADEVHTCLYNMTITWRVSALSSPTYWRPWYIRI